MTQFDEWYIEGILWKGPYLPCLCIADRALLAGYPRYVFQGQEGPTNIRYQDKYQTCHTCLCFKIILNTVWCGYNAVNFLRPINKRHPIARPLGRGMSFVDPESDCYSTSVTVIIDAISYYIGPRYNGTRLYCFSTCFIVIHNLNNLTSAGACFNIKMSSYQYGRPF